MNYHEKNQQELFEKWKEEFETCHFEGPEDFLWIYVMKGCGCGSSDDFRKDFWDMFIKIAEKKEDKFTFIYENKYNELIAQMLDSRGLLEHGTSIAGSWLSTAGQKLYELLKSKTISYPLKP